MKELLSLRKYLRPYRKKLAAGIFFLSLTNVLELAVPGVLAHGLASIEEMFSLGTFRLQPLLLYGGLLVGIAIVRGSLSYAQRTCISVASRYIERDIRNDIFAHLTSLAPSFFTRSRTGDIIARATNDLNAVREVLGMGVMYSIDAFNKFAGVLIILMLADVKITLIVILPLLATPILTRMFGGMIHRQFTEVQEKFSDLNAKAQENFSGIRVVQSFAQESNEIARFNALTAEHVERNIRLARLRSYLFPSVHAVAGLAIVVSIFFGGLARIRGDLAPADFFKFITYVPMLMWPMFAVGLVILIVHTGSASMRRINQLLGERPTIADPPDGVELKRAVGKIEFRDFAFTYQGAAKTAVSGINLSIPAGQTVAIVGPTGSGKSTLAAAVARLLEVEPGHLFVDGHDVTRVSLGSLRRQIGYVPQDTFLFSDTIRDNIAFGLADPPDGTVERAAGVSRLSNDIDQIPGGYDAVLGERGVNLSGGQRQRAAISRAVILDPPILILDDCLSAVDTGTEAEILAEISTVMARRTSIIISHRVSAVQRADKIVVLDGGVIAEEGSHHDLLAEGGIYARMYRKQRLVDELEMIP